MVARVIRAHGVRGELVLRRFGEAEEILRPGTMLCLRKGDGLELEVEQARAHKSGWIVSFAGLRDRAQAEQLIGVEVTVDESMLPPLEEGTFYAYQLEGLRVVTGEGEELGHLDSILETGARDVYVVQGPRGEILLPAIPDVIDRVDLEAGEVVVTPMPGMLPEPNAAPERSRRKPRRRRRPGGTTSTERS